MYLIFKVGAKNGPRYKVEAAWLSIDDPHDRMINGYRYCQVAETEANSEVVNRVLNELSSVQIALNSDGVTCGFPVLPSTAPTDIIHARKIAAGSWNASVRPAWQRAATASGFLNL